MSKLHLGCGKRYLPGYIHIDYSSYEHIDYKKPIYPLPFINNSSVDEIYCSHALEYFDYSEGRKVLNEWKRCLSKGGILRLSVPDFDQLIKVYLQKNSDIASIIGPMFGRWEVEKNKFIYHKTIYTRKKLIQALEQAGFTEIDEWNPLEFHGSNQDSFDDYSKAYFPHMDFKKGFPISINLMGKA